MEAVYIVANRAISPDNVGAKAMEKVDRKGSVEKGSAEYAIALTMDALRYTGRSEIISMADQENIVGAVADLVAEWRNPAVPWKHR